MSGLLSIEFLVLIFTGFCDWAFWKAYNGSKNNDPAKETYKTFFLISLIVSAIDFLLLIPLTIIYLG